jgi:hypothetical protein
MLQRLNFMILVQLEIIYVKLNLRKVMLLMHFAKNMIIMKDLDIGMKRRYIK